MENVWPIHGTLVSRTDYLSKSRKQFFFSESCQRVRLSKFSWNLEESVMYITMFLLLFPRVFFIILENP